MNIDQKGFKGAVVNRTLLCLHEGSLEVMVTITLS